MYPAGDTWPADATIDYAANTVEQNFTIARPGTNGVVNIHNFGSTAVSVWVDVAGYFTKTQPTGPTLRPLQPARLISDVSVAAGDTTTLTPMGHGGIPSSKVQAVMVDVSAKSSAAGAVEVYPSGTADPQVHTVGYKADTAATGATIAKLGADGKLTIKNTGSTATTVSVDVYGYFRPGLTFTQWKAAPSDDSWPEGVRVNSLTPTLSAQASSAEAGSIDYTFQVAPVLSDSPLATGTAASVAAADPGTWKVPDDVLSTPGVYRFRVEASDGEDTIWSPWRWLLVDAALIPSALTEELDDPTTPILSGTVHRPSGGEVTGRFYLFDSSGTPVGDSPLGVGSTQSGQQVSMQLPDGLVQAGQTYKWQMDACVQDACGSRSALRSFTVPQAPPAPQTQDITLGSDKIQLRTAKIGDTACSGAACPLTGDSAVRLGGSGSDEQVTLVKVDLDSLPAGARATSATLHLGSASCGSGCPGTATLSAYQPRQALSSSPTGAEAVATALTDPVDRSTRLDGADLNLGALATSWQEEPAYNDGVVLRAQGDGLPAFDYPTGGLSVTVTYIPAAAPAAPEAVTTLTGDGAAQITWAPPSDSGAAPTPAASSGKEPTSPITGYDIQVLDSGDQVVDTLTATEPHVTATGLTDGTAYRFKIRAHGQYGAGDWTTSGTVTPQAIPGGADQFVNAAKQYLTSHEGLMQGTFANADEAVAANSAGESFRALLSTQAAQILRTRADALLAKAAQLSTRITFPQVFVGYSPTDKKVTVRMDYEGTTVYANDVGTSAEQDTDNDFSDQSDFTFTLPGGASSAVLNSIASADPSPNTIEINAYTAAQAAEQPLDTGQFIDATTGTAPGAGQTAHTAAVVSNIGIAGWAYDHYATKHDYKDDCANFVSKAIRYGGGARYISPGWYRNSKYWWKNSLNRTWSFTGAYYNYEHFSIKHSRVIWEPSFTSVELGDIIYWRYKTWTKVGHVSVVTKKTRNDKYGIFYTHHTGTHNERNKPYWPTARDYPQVGFAWIKW